MASQRNVLLIVVDQWRADFMPVLGADFLRTPNLDRLCREGVTFRNHVTTAVPCGPARASLLTGLYLMNHRAVQNTVPLDARHMTLPRALRHAGVDPALIGYTTTTPDPRTTDRRADWRAVAATPHRSTAPAGRVRTSAPHAEPSRYTSRLTAPV